MHRDSHKRHALYEKKEPQRTPLITAHDASVQADAYVLA